MFYLDFVVFEGKRGLLENGQAYLVCEDIVGSLCKTDCIYFC